MCACTTGRCTPCWFKYRAFAFAPCVVQNQTDIRQRLGGPKYQNMAVAAAPAALIFSLSFSMASPTITCTNPHMNNRLFGVRCAALQHVRRGRGGRRGGETRKRQGQVKTLLALARVILHTPVKSRCLIYTNTTPTPPPTPPIAIAWADPKTAVSVAHNSTAHTPTQQMTIMPFRQLRQVTQQ